LLDLELPGIGGAAFRARQLCEPRLAEIPLIVVSGGEQLALKGHELGAIDFLAKPFTTEELLHVVQNRALTMPKDLHFLRGAMHQRSLFDGNRALRSISPRDSAARNRRSS
jgi:FixJ family two-component response regulator